jgi:hypothetical protein
MSGRTMARTRLRMMPTFPSSSLRFRTAGFPQYGSKAGLSDGAFPRGVHMSRRMVCLRPSCSSWQTCTLRSEAETPVRLSTAVRATLAALPQGPSLRSGLFCPGPSSLNRPHPPQSLARRHFTALRLISGVFAVPAGLGDLRLVPCFRCSLFLDVSCSKTPESPPAAYAQSLRRRRWPSPNGNWLGTLNTPIRPRSIGNRFRGFLLRSLATTRRVARPPVGPNRNPSNADNPMSLTPPGRGSLVAFQPSGTFTPELSTIRSPSSSSGMTTVSIGQSSPAGLSPARTSASIAALPLPVTCFPVRRARRLPLLQTTGDPLQFSLYYVAQPCPRSHS